MQIKFITSAADYNETDDTLTAVVDRLEDNVERFNIILDFFSRHYSIQNTDFSGDVEMNYMSRILAAFVDAFNARYMAIDHICSPAEALEEPIEFVVEA